MKKKICFLAILFAFVMQSTSVWSNTLGISPVSMYRKYVPKLDGNLKPSKAPANLTVPFIVFLDEDNQQLMVTSISAGDYTYCIYDNCDSVVTQGVICCSVNTTFTIDLWLYQAGLFSIVFTNEGNIYEGEFEIEK